LAARRSIRRTAVYGPVCTVVWEGRSREASPYPDSIGVAFVIPTEAGRSRRLAKRRDRAAAATRSLHFAAARGRVRFGRDDDASVGTGTLSHFPPPQAFAGVAVAELDD